MIIFLILIPIIIFIIAIRRNKGYRNYYSKYSRNEMIELMKGYADGSVSHFVEDFFEFRKGLFGIEADWSGVYMIYNETQKKHFIGKSNNVFDRINRHFTGNGNNNIYADYKYGDVFTIKTIFPSYNDYETLDELVKHKKEEYNKFSTDYSKKNKNTN